MNIQSDKRREEPVFILYTFKTNIETIQNIFPTCDYKHTKKYKS